MQRDTCLLYTSDAADDLTRVDLGGRRIIKTKKHHLLDAPVVSWGYSSNITGHTGFDAYTGSTLLERRFQWQGTRDLSAFLSVPAAIEFQARHDWDSIR